MVCWLLQAMNNNKDKEVQGVVTKVAGDGAIRNKVSELICRVKELQGDPHYIAMGVAIGVFVGVTPTIPFHTVLAIALAFVLRGSKPAAIIGVWFANPVTVPLFYIGSYKVGVFVFGGAGGDLPGLGPLLETLEGPYALAHKFDVLGEFFNHHFDVACMMLAGGILLGIPLAVISYFVTRRIAAGALTGINGIKRVVKSEKYNKDLDK